MRDLIAFINEYATARGAAERHHGLLESLVDDNDGLLAAKIADHEGAATACHARLMTAYDQLTRTTIRAVADERLPVCTWQKASWRYAASCPTPRAASESATPRRRPSPPEPR